MSDLDPSTFPSLPQLKALRVVDLKERLTALGLDTKGELICQGKRLCIGIANAELNSIICPPFRIEGGPRRSPGHLLQRPP